MEDAFDGVNVLRWHYGMIGQPKTLSRPAVKPFPQACGLALGMKDPATFECFCPVLIFNPWDPDRMIQATPDQNLGRLRLAAGIGLFFLNFSRLGIPWAMESAVALKHLEKRLQDYTLKGDPWGDPLGANEPDGYYLEFFKSYGLYANWPLIDFWKQFKWAMRQNHERVREMLEKAETAANKTLFQKKEPTIDEKKALKGRTNVEALLYALDQRMMGKTLVVLVGRASYEIGNEDLTAQLRQALREDPKIDERTGRVLLTDDIGCCLTDEAQPLVDAGHPDSYVAKLADCYVHALNERTLTLPKDWDQRVQNIPVHYENLKLKRLDPLDFVICKGAASRPKDIEFLRAFCKAMDIRQSAVEAKIQVTLANPPLQLRFDALSQRNLRNLAGKLFPPSSVEIS